MRTLGSAPSIQLTRIHAIQWYGFCDTFDLLGQTVITGVYGCGKTGLVDLIQTVLLGPPDRETRYNLALAGIGGTGKEVKRDLRGYCLQDLNVTEHGHPVYARKSTRTYIALEFTWPDGKRRETWGIRVEYTSVGADPAFMFWKVPARLEFTDFLGKDEVLLDAEDWEHLLGRHKERPLPSRELYLEAICATQHLHFNRRIFKPLLLHTLQFSFGKDFTEFCRKHILPEEVIDLETVRASFDRYKGLVDRMRLLQDQEVILVEIEGFYSLRQKLDQEVKALEWFQQRLAVDEAQTEVLRRAQELEALRVSTREWREKRDKLLAAQAEAELKLREIQQQLRNDPNALDFHGLKQRQKVLPREIEDLKAAVANPVADLRTKATRARTLWEEAERATREYEWTPPPKSLDHSLPATVDANQLGQHVTLLAAALDPLANHYDAIARRAEEQRTARESRLNGLRRTVARLKERKSIEDLPLHEALLAKFGPQRVRLVGSLCEVTDDEWTDALEINFVHKYASLVANEDVRAAFATLNDLPRVNGRERLLCPRDFATMTGSVQPGSLAEKITSKDAGVRKLLAQLFGNVACCKTIDEAEERPRAILPNGAIKEPGGRRRQRETVNDYLIGESGRRRMIALREAEVVALLPQYAAAQAEAAAARRAAGGFQDIKIGLLQLSADKVDLLRQLEEKLREQGEVHRDLSRFEGREQLEKLHRDAVRAQQLADDAGDDVREHKTREPADLAAAETVARETREAHERRLEGLLKWQLAHPLSFEAASRNTGLSAEIEGESTSTRSGSVVAELLCERRKTNMERVQADLRDRRKSLKTDSRFPDYRDVVEDDYEDNTFFAKKLSNIRESGLSDLTKEAAKAEAEWEDRFQRQVLGQLSHHIAEIRQTFEGLRRIIAGQAIGGATYEFSYRAVERPAFARLRQLAEGAELDTLLAADDPKLVALRADRRAAMESLAAKETDARSAKGTDARSAERVHELLDARYYFTYDMEIQEAGRAEKVSLERRGRKASGGETYNPYFIALMTAYLRAYWRHDSKAKPAISLLLMDEAFKVLNSEAVRDCVQIIQEFGLQGVISCTDTNGGQIVEFFQWIMIVQKRVTPGGPDGHDDIENTIYAAPRNDPVISRLLDEIT